MPHMRLTDAAIAGLAPPPKGQSFYRDTVLGGLAVRVSAGGRKTFVLEKLVLKRTRRITIGPCDAMPVRIARDKAKGLLAKIALGIDPVDEKRREARLGVTLGAVFQEYLALRLLRARTVGNYKRAVSVAFVDWKDRPLAEITRAMVIARFEYLRDEHGPAWANLCMRVLRSLFNLAVAKYADEEGRSPFVNPVRILSETRSWAKVDRRRTLIAPHDLRAWHDAAADLTPTAHAYLVTVLLTGLRRREAGSLRWEDIDFDRGVLTLRQTKNGKPHVLPIPNYLRGLLSGLKAPGALADSHVFPGVASNTGRLQAAVLRGSGVRFTIHDLRRTFITVAESLDIPAFALKRLLNHADGQDVTAGYIVIGTVRAPIEKIAGYFESAMGIEEKQIAPFSKIA